MITKVQLIDYAQSMWRYLVMILALMGMGICLAAQFYLTKPGTDGVFWSGFLLKHALLLGFELTLILAAVQAYYKRMLLASILLMIGWVPILV